jgi:hypothetical protein
MRRRPDEQDGQRRVRLRWWPRRGASPGCRP